MIVRSRARKILVGLALVTGATGFVSAGHADVSPVGFVLSWQACVGSRLTRGITNRKARNFYFNDQKLGSDSGLTHDEITAVTEGHRPLSYDEALKIAVSINAHIDWLLCVDSIRAQYGTTRESFAVELPKLPAAFASVARRALRLAAPPSPPVVAEAAPVVEPEPTPEANTDEHSPGRKSESTRRRHYTLHVSANLDVAKFEEIWIQKTAKRLREASAALWDDRETRITTREVEREAGISATRYNKRRHGRVPIALDEGYALGKLLRVDPKYLLDFKRIRRQFKDPKPIEELIQSRHQTFREVALFALGLTSAEAIVQRPPRPRLRGCARSLTTVAGNEHAWAKRVRQIQKMNN